MQERDDNLLDIQLQEIDQNSWMKKLSSNPLSSSNSLDDQSQQQADFVRNYQLMNQNQFANKSYGVDADNYQLKEQQSPKQ